MIYVLAMVLVIGKNEVIIKPVKIYNMEQFSYPVCVMERDAFEKETHIPMTCYQMGQDI